MGRSIFDDITPPQRAADAGTHGHSNSIRNVAPVETQERSVRRERRAGRRTLPPSAAPKRTRSGGNFGIWAVAILIFVVALSTIGFVFIGKTTITVIPHQETLTLSDNLVYTAYRNAEDGELGFSVITDTLEASDTIAATGSEEVKEKASGRITVYNTYSTSAQKLIKNTRFEAPNGEIYRIRNSIDVPGKKADGTPGELEVTVYADKEGADQNISGDNVRFTIPGLKGGPQYDAFYATLTEPITGGFVGERAVVNEDELNALQTKLREELRSKIAAAVAAKVPASDVSFDNSVFTTFESAPVAYTDKNTATVKEIARVSIVSFNAVDFAHMLATTALAAPLGGDILVDDTSLLTMKVVNQEGVDVASDSLLQFTLAGPATLTWQVDTASLAHDLTGKHSAALNSIMSAYPGIKSAQATIRPFWKKEFPTDAGSITINITKEQ